MNVSPTFLQTGYASRFWILTWSLVTTLRSDEAGKDGTTPQVLRDWDEETFEIAESDLSERPTLLDLEVGRMCSSSAEHGERGAAGTMTEIKQIVQFLRKSLAAFYPAFASDGGGDSKVVIAIFESVRAIAVFWCKEDCGEVVETLVIYCKGALMG